VVSNFIVTRTESREEVFRGQNKKILKCFTYILLILVHCHKQYEYWSYKVHLKFIFKKQELIAQSLKIILSRNRLIAYLEQRILSITNSECVSSYIYVRFVVTSAIV